ncbi:Hpt domain-containing protein [Luteimonas sp. M1R5S59]|uniref:histidine kinase n=1 Tax=Luteimonas kalidii TaxID=3042025 RepID=A0ABT6JT15_9GAMM|nr:Hpt domain-containing protein [Luteimonas kalidii]MDH5833106.1 Hpt domain-containing protein [Luteimonas kalidii]
MTALREALEHTALGWIKPELDETLRLAKAELEDYVEDPADVGRMRLCAGYLHQVQGTLRMVELYAPAMVAEEMEHVAQALHAGSVDDRDGACAALLRGIVLLPDYLERLQSGHRDIPIVLLPLLNELRATRGESGLSESVLFSPDLERPLPGAIAGGMGAAASNDDVQPLLEALQRALAAWQDAATPETLTPLPAAVDALLPHVRQVPVRRMLWVASNVSRALADGALPASAGLRKVFAGVEREARRGLLDNDGFAEVRGEAAQEPTRQLLYHVAHHDDASHPALHELKQVFELDAALPTASELEHARGSISGRNRALLDTVSAAVKDDLLHVKDALDLHLRTGSDDLSSLQPHAETLGRVADTLGMLGLGVARKVVQQQRDAMLQILDGTVAADEDALLDVAGALLYVDATLDDQVARLGASDTGASAENELFAGETRQVVDTIVREAIANFVQARQALVAFVETSWQHEQLSEVPRLLDEVSGALRMMELPLPADYLVAVSRYTETELIGRQRVPNGRQLDTLADALASLEYYLEALREQRGNRDEILDIARNSLESLGYWPLPQAPEKPAPVAEVAAPVVSAPAIDLPDTAGGTNARSVAPAAQAAAPARASEPVVGGFETVGEEIDEEIREVFLEEFAEEIDNLDGLLPLWRARPEDMERLRPIRRVFHTLKGSGRLVGARMLGEFSWKIENMLNRVLDGSRPPSEAVIAMVDRAFYTLPELQSALRGERSLTTDLEPMQAAAERIAGGDEGMPPETAAAVAMDASAHVPEAVDATAVEPVSPPAVDEVGIEPLAVGLADAGEPLAAVPAKIDALLLEILDAEVNGHLQTVDAWVARARDGDAAGSDPLLRALHTMNGAFAMTEVPVINSVLSPAEHYARRLLASHATATPDGVDALADLSAAVRETVETLKQPAPALLLQDALAARLVALRDSLPEAASGLAALVDAQGLEEAGAMPDTPQPPDAIDLTTEDLTAYAGLVDAPLVDAMESAPAGVGQEEDERLEAERVEAERLEAERLGAERLEAERLEAERLEAERLEAERLEAERLEAERLEAERLEAERLEAERLEAERLEAERLEAERLEAERLEAERLEAERLEAERLEAERLEAERLEAERLEAERLEAERLEAERLEAERLEAERLEAERVDAQRPEAQVSGTDGGTPEAPDAEPVEADRLETEYLETMRLEAEFLEAERLEAERLEAERLETERLETERLETERLEAERLEAESLETERLEAERLEAERQAAHAAQVADDEAAAAEVSDEDDAGVPVDTAVAALLARVLSKEDPDEALDVARLDEELVDIFVEEAGDLLDHSDGLLAQLRQSPDAREPLIGLQRDLHTIKGGARMAGVFTVGELGHAMESLLEAVVEQRCELDRIGIGLLEGGFDRLHAMITRIGDRRAIAMPDALIDAFNALARGRPLLVEDDAAADAEPVEPKVELAPLSGPITDLGADDDTTIRAPQEQVRIRADLLDRLVNYAGEVAIYRARLEQQLGAFRAAMNEMEQTNARLRDQLRRLDIETEAQIIARYQREGDAGDVSFDPLELDRFSTLQQLSRGLGESAADMTSLQQTLDDLTRQYETLLLQQSRVSSELQEGLMRTRMVPFDALVPRLRRVLRQAAQETGKQVQLRLDGSQGELDRNVLERMTAPLEHMLRNAVAHGIESPERRRKAKKPDEGTVRIAVRREGSEVVLEVGDDGSGLDRGAIRRRAQERGLIRDGAVLSDGDLDALIFEPGFSTADEVSRLAGRGVGMDVVASEVRQLGGSLDIATRREQGTTFTLRLPQTLAVTQAVFVRIGETQFAVPIASVRGVGRIERGRLGDAEALYAYGGEDYGLHDLGLLVGQAPARADGHLQMPLLLVRSGELRAAVAVDEIIGSREIVVKPVGPQVASIPGIFGATIMGDGSVVVILDVAPLARRHAVLPRDTGPVVPVEQRPVPLVMVVDDSVTMRKVTGRVLERHNFEVITAKDGLDALERMDERVPDLMLLDIEMPRMDGYELAKHMKADPRLRDVLIMMITSRTGEKHRQRAFDLGVDRYLGKPYQEPELMRNVNELLKVPHGRD